MTHLQETLFLSSVSIFLCLPPPPCFLCSSSGSSLPRPPLHLRLHGGRLLLSLPDYFPASPRVARYTGAPNGTLIQSDSRCARACEKTGVPVTCSRSERVWSKTPRLSFFSGLRGSEKGKGRRESGMEGGACFLIRSLSWRQWSVISVWKWLRFWVNPDPG